jgi:hypothetical protein
MPSSQLTITFIVATFASIAAALQRMSQRDTFPVSWHLSQTQRLVLVAIVGALSAVLTSAAARAETWGAFGSAILLGLMATAPALISEIVTIETEPPTTPSPPPLPPVLGAACLALVLTGCAGSFEEARLVRHGNVAAAPPSQRCVSLDSQHRAWGAVAKGAAFASGASGLATIPVRSDAARDALAVGSVIAGITAATSVYVAEDTAAAWARECAQ